MAWNVIGPRTVEYSYDLPSATVTDMLGKTKTMRPTGGKLAIEVGPCPIYITADRKEAPK